MARSSQQRGQVVLITLLILAIGTTVALSLMGRVTTDVGISSQIEESSRAFSAAEAGIEEALKTGEGSGGPKVLTPGGVSYQTTVSNVGGSTAVYKLPQKTPKGNTETLWFVNFNPDGTLDEKITYIGENVTLCWSNETPVIPAVVVGILYKENGTGTYKVARVAFDPDTNRADTNNFTTNISLSGCGMPDYYRRNITFAPLGITPGNEATSDILLAMRVRPVYADTFFAFNPGTFTVPLQGVKIESVGSTETGTARKVVVYKYYTSALTLFDAAIFSQSYFGHP